MSRGSPTAYVAAKDYLHALRIRRLIVREVDALFAQYDAIVCPTTNAVASPITTKFSEYFKTPGGRRPVIGAVGQCRGAAGDQRAERLRRARPADRHPVRRPRRCGECHPRRRPRLSGAHRLAHEATGDCLTPQPPSLQGRGAGRGASHVPAGLGRVIDMGHDIRIESPPPVSGGGQGVGIHENHRN